MLGGAVVYHRGDESAEHLDITHGQHQDADMRTTLTLEPDVARRLRAELKRRDGGMKEIVNEALRIGLGMTDKPARPERFVVEPHAFGFRPGVDLDRLNQLVDELDVEEAARRLAG